MSTQMIGTLWQRWITFILAGNSAPSHITSADVKRTTVRLVRNELVHLRKRNRYREVSVRHGIIWLTGTPACGDVILHCGGRFEFGDQLPFLLQAMEDSEIELSA